jgi:hypothetical protein
LYYNLWLSAIGICVNSSKGFINSVQFVSLIVYFRRVVLSKKLNDTLEFSY